MTKPKILGFNEYQAKTITYHFCKDLWQQKTVHVLGLAGEAGEIVEKYKKHLRDGSELDTFDLAKELGDVLFYVAAVAADIGYDLRDVAELGLSKLEDRKKRGVLKGSGDSR